MKNNTLGIIFFPAYDWSIGPNHPEREERLLYTQDQLREEGLFDLPNISEHRPQIATEEDVLRAHILPPGLKRVAGIPHLISAGGAITAGRLVAKGETKKAFALVRPPGHHAMRVMHGGRGFCNLNNEAIMIQRLRQEFGIKKVAIVDTDCHHGDGTQDIYWHDPNTLFISLHQDGRTLYPGTGFPQELGGPQALGSTINIPLPPETGDEGFLLAATEIIRPILDEWRPDLIVNSAGQDNHFTDPITNMKFTAQGYAQLSNIINPDIAVLEGGYAIKGALPYTNLAIIMAMAGLDWASVAEPKPVSSKLSTSHKTLDYIKCLAQDIHRLRKNPDPYQAGYALKNGWWIRERSIFYDTHAVESGVDNHYSPPFINENQREELKACSNCPGLLIIRSQSEISPASVHKVVPDNACPDCLKLAEQY